MMWHERQKLVCLERSKCSEAPQNPQTVGSTKNATNANILPSREAVTEGPANDDREQNAADGDQRVQQECGLWNARHDLWARVKIIFFRARGSNATRSFISAGLSCFSYAGILFLPLAMTCSSTSSVSPCTSAE